MQKWLGKQSKHSSPQGLISLHYTILFFHTVKGDVPMENLQPNISSLYGLNTAKEKVLFLAQTMSQFVRAQGHVREKKNNKNLLNLIKNS